MPANCLTFSVSDLTAGLNKLKTTALKNPPTPTYTYLYIHESKGIGIVQFSAMGYALTQTSGVPCRDENGGRAPAFTVHAKSLFELLSALPKGKLSQVYIEPHTDAETHLIYGEGKYTLAAMSPDEHPVQQNSVDAFTGGTFAFNGIEFKAAVHKIESCALPKPDGISSFHTQLFWHGVIDEADEAPDEASQTQPIDTTALVVTDARMLGKTTLPLLSDVPKAEVAKGSKQQCLPKGFPSKGIVIPLTIIKEITKAFGASPVVAATLSEGGDIIRYRDRRLDWHEIRFRLLDDVYPQYQKVFRHKTSDTRICISTRELLAALKRIVKLHKKKEMPITFNIAPTLGTREAFNITAELSDYNRVQENTWISSVEGKPLQIKVNAKRLHDMLARFNSDAVVFHFFRSNPKEKRSNAGFQMYPYERSEGIPLTEWNASTSDDAYLLIPIRFDENP